MRHLYPVVSFAPKAHTGRPAAPADRVLELLDAMERRAPTTETPVKLPLTWVMPAAAFCDRGDERSREIREKIEARGDAMGALGLVGAIDQWLFTEEVEKSISWTLNNTWANGIEDAKAHVSFVLRAAADLERHETRALYEAAEFRTLLRAEHRGLPFIAAGSGDEAIPLLVVRGATTPAKNELNTLIRQRLKHESTRRDSLVLWIECPQDIAIAVAMLEQLTRECTRRGTTAAPLTAPGAFAPTEHPLVSPSILQPPASQLAKLTELRGRRGSMIATRRILEATAGSLEEESKDDAGDDLTGFAWTERSVTATMAGRAALSEQGLYALLEGGRFAGVYPDVCYRDLLPPARSLVLPIEAGRVVAPTKTTQAVEEEVHSCVSFESEISRGARSTLLVDEEQVQALVYNEYSIVTDHSALVMTQSLVANSENEHVLLTEGVPIERTPVRLTGRYRDGGEFERVVEATPTLTTRWSEAFEISIGKRIFAMVCLDPEARVIPWSVSWLSDPEPRLYLGTQMMLPGGRVATSFTLLLVPSTVEGSLVEKALVGNLPHEIKDEIAAGRAATRRSLQVQPEA